MRVVLIQTADTNMTAGVKTLLFEEYALEAF
jgi:hypothetical protein